MAGRFTLTELRRLHRLTQRDLAKRLGVTQQAVSNWEAGTRVPRLEMAKRIAALFGVHVDQILFPGEHGATQQPKSA